MHSDETSENERQQDDWASGEGDGVDLLFGFDKTRRIRNGKYLFTFNPFIMNLSAARLAVSTL